jgi:pentatricopeptide repeat protein
MITDHMISAKSEHYTCMINLLGRAGHLQEAENMIKAMPCKPDVMSWKAFLSACRIHGNVEMGEHVAKQVLELELASIAGYVLLSSIYAAADSRNLCENVEQQKKQRGVKKLLGHTQIEVSNEVRTMNVVDNEYHPCRTAEIVRALA